MQLQFESDEYQNMNVQLLTHDINGSMFEREEGAGEGCLKGFKT